MIEIVYKHAYTFSGITLTCRMAGNFSTKQKRRSFGTRVQIINHVNIHPYRGHLRQLMPERCIVFTKIVPIKAYK